MSQRNVNLAQELTWFLLMKIFYKEHTCNLSFYFLWLLCSYNKCLAIESNNPLAPVHFLVIPKKNIDNLSYVNENDQQVVSVLSVSVN